MNMSTPTTHPEHPSTCSVEQIYFVSPYFVSIKTFNLVAALRKKSLGKFLSEHRIHKKRKLKFKLNFTLIIHSHDLHLLRVSILRTHTGTHTQTSKHMRAHSHACTHTGPIWQNYAGCGQQFLWLYNITILFCSYVNWKKIGRKERIWNSFCVSLHNYFKMLYILVPFKYIQSFEESKGFSKLLVRLLKILWENFFSPKPFV